MRVAILAAGAGGMLCGSCLRDNRLAATLRSQGRDVNLIPLYTPLRTDEEDASEPTVYYGGINVYLQQKFAPFRRLPAALDGMLNAPALLRRVGRAAARVHPHEVAALTVSVLRGEHGRQNKELSRLIRGLRLLRPDLINLPNLLLLGLARRIRQELGAAVVCTLSGEDIFIDALPEPYRGQALREIRERSGDADAFIAVTRYYARHATEHFGLPGERVHVVPLGIRGEDFAPRAESERPVRGGRTPAPHRERSNQLLPDAGESSERPSAPPPAFTIGYMARVCPEKGLDRLCEALAELRSAGRDCRVLAAGYLAPADRPYLTRILARLHERGVEAHFEYRGEVTRESKIALFTCLHVLSVPSTYREAKGLYVLEALAGGVPVVQPRHGSFPELIQQTGGGLLYDPDEPGALAAAVARLMDDESLRRRLAAAGQAAVRERFTDVQMAEGTWAVFERVRGSG